MKYTKAELLEKEAIYAQITPLLRDQQNLLHEKYTAILKALADSGFWISKDKKIREGYCYLKRQGKPSKKLYTVLYKEFIYFFKPQAKVSINERPYSLVNLKFITACDYEQGQNTFSITTPLRKFILRTKHEIAVDEWISKIRSYVPKKSCLTPLKNAKEKISKTNDWGYRYSKPVNKLMSVIETLESGKQKVHKLSKAGSSTLGRSASNDVTLTDKYISRSHCKIIVENNVPYVCDLGQAKTGTLLNGNMVTKAPLKPGDIISIGKSDIIFQVKNGPTIFTCTKQPPQIQTEIVENDNSFLSSTEDEFDGLKLKHVMLEKSESSK